jgi:hypothetical protein
MAGFVPLRHDVNHQSAVSQKTNSQFQEAGMRSPLRVALRFGTVLALLFAIFTATAAAQRLTGSISGQVLDPQGAVVPKANITVSNDATGFKRELRSSADGSFTVSDLPPSVYSLKVDATGFAPFTTTVPVNVGVSTPVTARLGVGTTATEVSVQANAVTVDTTKATVQGVITADRIEKIPLNGRNFLALAALEPGVQIVDGGSFDPTKNQFAGVSVGGRSGRVTRIQVDGVDITDETVGTTVTNISNESIQEFGISQSSLDPSTDITSSGAVNIITRSGTNNLHGSAFGLFRDAKFAADQRLNKTVPSTEKPPFDRQQWGGRFGGPLVKNKLFWHVEYEQTSQDSQQFTNIPEFPQFTGVFSSPVDETMGGGRMDYNLTNNQKVFYRFTHNHNIGVTGFGGVDLSAFSNRNNTNAHVAGWDYGKGRWSHSVRFSYLNFNNFIAPANGLAGTPLTLDPGGKPLLVRITGRLNDVGPDLLAPQNTFQDNKQSKYDGSFIAGNHTIRFGGSYNKIDEVVFADFFGIAPRIRASYTGAGGTVFAASSPFASGGITNPLNFRLNQIVLGNGLGAFSEKPALGFKFGGTTNHRLGFYAQDTWKMHPNLTVNYGLRWNFNSMLSDSDLERTRALGLFDPSLLGKPRQPKDNFGPQAGFAWNMFGNNKTVIRGGAGIFYETNIINNVLFDRPLNLPPGFGNDTPVINASSPLLLDPKTGATLVNFNTACGGASCFSKPLGAVIPVVLAAQQSLQAATAALAANYPPPGVAPLFDQILSTEGSLVDTNYKSPYAAQFNVGVQREIRDGLVLSVDYIHNRGARFNLVRDRNRLGAANTLDLGLAQNAMAATFGDFGCPFAGFANATTTQVRTAVNCVIAAGGGISDFAFEGLGGGSGLDGLAFRGQNPNFRDMGVIESIGLSRFQALQVRLTGRLGNFGFFRNVNANVNYQLGRFESTGIDQDFISSAGFNDRPTKFFGPANQDRLHQVGISVLFDLPLGFSIATTSSMKSALPTSLFLPPTTGDPSDEIYFSDLDGDGVIEDPLTGVKPRGAFGSGGVNAGNINKYINAYNTTVAGTILPAGQALIAAGLFTDTQLKSLGAVATHITPAPSNQLNNDNFYNTDLRLSNRIKVTERVTIEPAVEIFNVFNIANYARLGSSLDGSAGSANGTPSSLPVRSRSVSRLGFGSGSFSPGTQRAFQFGVRVSF